MHVEDVNAIRLDNQLVRKSIRPQHSLALRILEAMCKSLVVHICLHWNFLPAIISVSISINTQSSIVRRKCVVQEKFEPSLLCVPRVSQYQKLIYVKYQQVLVLVAKSVDTIVVDGSLTEQEAIWDAQVLKLHPGNCRVAEGGHCVRVCHS